MPADSESFPTSPADVAAARFDRNGVTAYNLSLRLTGSPGAAWYATIAAFAAVTERVPADAAAGVDDQDVVLMSCWHGRQLLAQVAADPDYAEQLRAHDAATRAGQDPDPPVAGANAALGIDQRELLAMNGLSGLDHAGLAGLLHADPGLLAVMVAESRLRLHDLLRGGDLADRVGSGGDDRRAIALAALRQDGQLEGPDAQSTLDDWLAADPSHDEIVAALETAGDAYRSWPLTATPAGLREAAVAAAVATTPAPLLGTPQPPPVEEMPAGEHDRPIEPPSAPDAPSADPGATVEWSSSDVAALGLEGAPVRPAARPAAPVPLDDDPVDEWPVEDEDDYDAPLNGDERRERAPRWHVALVGVLLVAVIVVLFLMLTGGDEPTDPVPSGTTAPTPRSAAPADPPAVAAVIRVTAA
ncbi:MAG: hypothetical protein ITG02_15660 [Patulibacter sp.]|nr:hypothetical protein [Patulibacter sp.]